MNISSNKYAHALGGVLALASYFFANQTVIAIVNKHWGTDIGNLVALIPAGLTYVAMILNLPSPPAK